MIDNVKNNDFKSVSDKKPITISRWMAFFILILGVILIIPPSIGFLHDILKINFEFLELKSPVLFFELVKEVGVHQFGFLCIIIFIFLVHSIYKATKNKKYKMHAFSGMLGLSLSFLSISLLCFFQKSSLFFLFIFSGFSCAYCVSVPIYMWCFNRFKEKGWEPVFITVVFGSIITYFLNGYSEIIINEVYTVDAKYFFYTKPIVMFLLLTPLISFSSLSAFCLILWKEFRSKKNNSKTFYNLNKMMACYVLISTSLVFMNNPIKILELTSSTFDFGSVSPCYFKDSYNGYIVLDPAHTKVLTYSKGNPSPYTVRECKLK